MNYIKSKWFCIAKETHAKMRATSTKLKIFAYNILDKGLKSKI